MAKENGCYEVEYQKLWNTMKIRKSKRAIVKKIAKKLRKYKDRYKRVAKKIGCPWQVVAVIHQMESGARFDRHLHNGDPLTARTKHIPRGRPKKGKPPFTWEESAIDALRFQGFHKVEHWDIPTILYQLEKYNGFGYRKYHHINTPYLWSCTNHYVMGKYTADGHFDKNAVSKQCGAAPILRELFKKQKESKEKKKKRPDPLDILRGA